MAMLAETRKKQKWTLNPRGSAWANDSSKFGEKLLRKMGWSDGQGLGAKKQGISEHVKVRVKHDSKGLGFKDNDQVWVEVENDFSNLLSKLSSQNEKEGKTESSSSPIAVSVESVNRSLEEQSKKSRARVHYKKFTRGKDLSRYSKKDLECIFGVSSKAESKHEENKNFVQSGTNMSEYFSEKSSRKTSKSELASQNNVKEEVNTTENNDIDETLDDVPKKKKKKSKKRKHEDCENNPKDIEGLKGGSNQRNEEIESHGENFKVPSKKSKKNIESLIVVGDSEETITKVKKKKKKSKSEEIL